MFGKKHSGIIVFVFALCIIANAAVANDDAVSAEAGVYEYVVHNAQGSLDEIAAAISSAAEEAGWTSLATMNAGVPKDCGFASKVVLLYDKEYANAVMRMNGTTGPYAVLDRINIFQDEAGTHVSVVNPHSITRTVLMENSAFEEKAETHLTDLRGLITKVVKGEVSHDPYGQMRDKGYIGKTMGVVAGGKFGDLIKNIASVKDAEVTAVAHAIRAGFLQPSKKWGLHVVCEVDLPEFDTVLLGVTGTPMDSKSFDIVKAGADESRKDYACPGIADAAAYPFEIVIVKHDGVVRVQIVDVMFRMKMYFEDAGKWAFMNNMKMPGSIAK